MTPQLTERALPPPRPSSAIYTSYPSLQIPIYLSREPPFAHFHSMKRTPGRRGLPTKGDRRMACNKCKCSSCRSGCGNRYASVNCGGCSSGCNGNYSGSCASCDNGYGALRSVSIPFSNCGNWNNWNGRNYPYYTGPCGPCEPCRNCCCPHWPWPLQGYSSQDCNCGRCHHCGCCGCGCTDSASAGNTTEVVTTRTTTTQTDMMPLVPLSAYGSGRCISDC